MYHFQPENGITMMSVELSPFPLVLVTRGSLKKLRSEAPFKQHGLEKSAHLVEATRKMDETHLSLYNTGKQLVGDTPSYGEADRRPGSFWTILDQNYGRRRRISKRMN